MKLIHNYLLDKQLCENDMVRVFRAKDRERQELFTLTVIKDDYQINPDYLLTMISSRDKHQSDHPHVAKIIDFGELRQQQYFVSRYAGGKTLASFLNKSAPLPVTFAVDVISQLASGLHFLSLQGRIHGNINPDNIFFDQYGNAILTGQEIIPKHVDNARAYASRYHSPEVVVGDAVDERSDLYSLGVILFELLTSEKFSSRKYVDENEIINVNELTPFLPEDNFGFQPIINKLLAKNPKQRYSNGLELVDALDEYDSRLSHEAESDFVLDFEDDLKDGSGEGFNDSFESTITDEFEYGSFRDDKQAINTQPEHLEINTNDDQVFIDVRSHVISDINKVQSESIENNAVSSDTEVTNNRQIVASSHKQFNTKQKTLKSLLFSLKQRLRAKRKVKHDGNMFDASNSNRHESAALLEKNLSREAADLNRVGGLKKMQTSYASNFDPDIGSYLNTHTNDEIAKRLSSAENNTSFAVASELQPSTSVNAEFESTTEFNVNKNHANGINDRKLGGFIHRINRKIAFVAGVSAIAVVFTIYNSDLKFGGLDNFVAEQVEVKPNSSVSSNSILLKSTSVESSLDQVEIVDKSESMNHSNEVREKEVFSATLPAEPTLKSSFDNSVNHVAAVISKVITVKNDNQISPPLITFEDVDVSKKIAIHFSEKVDMLLIKAQGYLSQLKFTTPKNKNAYAMYVAVLNIDPDNSEAKEGIENIAEGYAFMANRQINKENYEKASRYIEKGLTVQRDNEWLIKLKREVNEWLDVDETTEHLGFGAEAIAFDGIFD